ncbi:MAG: signal recognition particle-docking protein FtsY [archaeon]
MFGKLKEKLKNWTKKLTEKAEKVEEPVEEEPEKLEDIEEEPVEEIKEEKKAEEKKEKAREKIIEERQKEIKEKSEEIKPEEVEKPKEIKPSMEYNVGAHKFEPDLEKIEEKVKEIEKGKEEIARLEKEESKVKEVQPSKAPDIKAEAPSLITKPSDFEPPSKEQIKPRPGTKGFFKRVTSKITKIKISEKEFDVYAEELEMLLIENNVALEVAEKIVKELKEKVVGKELLKKEIEGEIFESFKDIIRGILIEPFNILQKIREKKEDQSKEPYVILFCGINGTGKTTTIAKIATYLKEQGVSCVLAAADTFRAASIEQLKTHGEKVGVKVIANEYGSDPASVGFDAIKYAKKNFIDCVLIDTAGRMHTSKNLLKEIEKINRVCKPDTKVFVGESITGNDAIEQARTFNWEIGIDGIVLTKADIDEKGGTALSVGYVTKKPILYLGTGQEYDAIEVFDKEKFIEKLGL